MRVSGLHSPSFQERSGNKLELQTPASPTSPTSPQVTMCLFHAGSRTLQAHGWKGLCSWLSPFPLCYHLEGQLMGFMVCSLCHFILSSWQSHEVRASSPSFQVQKLKPKEAVNLPKDSQLASGCRTQAQVSLTPNPMIFPEQCGGWEILESPYIGGWDSGPPLFDCVLYFINPKMCNFAQCHILKSECAVNNVSDGLLVKWSGDLVGWKPSMDPFW